MSVRSIQARLDCDAKTLDDLWRTHRVFNERLPAIISVLFKMRRGECGRNPKQRDLYQRIARFILAANAKNAEYLLHSVSIKGWTPNTAKKQKVRTLAPDGTPLEVSGTSWADEAAALSRQGVMLYNKEDVLGDLPGTLRQMVCRECVAVISGYDELVARWTKEHAEWLKDKEKWEADPEHQKYLALRPRFEAFEKQAGGKAGKRRGRWHLFLAWLKANPDLAAWRGKARGVADLSKQARERIRKAKPWKQRSVEADEFWKVNPELQALDKLHGFYERQFIRRRKTKKNPDGFDHRPTFTLPDAKRHPRWFVFNAPQTSPNGYRELRLPPKPGAEGSVELLLLMGEKGADGKYPSQWASVPFIGDPRLCLFRKVKKRRTVNRGKDKGAEKEADAYEFHDAHLGLWRPTDISGVKLIFRFNHDGTPKAAYLYFTCNIKDVPLTAHAKAIQWTETGEVTKKGKKRKRKTLPDGILTCAVDLGIRNLGFATLAVHEKGNLVIRRSRNLWVGWQEGGDAKGQRWLDGPDLAHIAKHKRKIRRLRRERGKPVKGESSHVELQTHIDHMGEDRFKRAARAIINFALNAEAACDRHGEVYPRADVLILENMDGLIPDAEKEHGINRALIAWNRGQLTKRIEEMAKDVGLKIIPVSPMGTSQVCCRCGSLGRRYTIGRDQRTGQAEIHFGFVEKLFACPSCGYLANADHNASVNLHRRFALDDKAVAGYAAHRQKGDNERTKEIADIEERLRPRLRLKHNLDGPVPF
jgi:transposase